MIKRLDIRDPRMKKYLESLDPKFRQILENEYYDTPANSPRMEKGSDSKQTKPGGIQ